MESAGGIRHTHLFAFSPERVKEKNSRDYTIWEASGS